MYAIYWFMTWLVKHSILWTIRTVAKTYMISNFICFYHLTHSKILLKIYLSCLCVSYFLPFDWFNGNALRGISSKIEISKNKDISKIKIKVQRQHVYKCIWRKCLDLSICFVADTISIYIRMKNSKILCGLVCKIHKHQPTLS